MKWITFLILAVVSFTLTACGGDDGLNAPSGTITSAEATNPAMKTNLDTVVNTLMTGIQTGGTLPGGVSAASFAEKAEHDVFAGCTTITPTALVDADSDNIAKEKNYVYDCEGIVADNHVTSKKGTVQIADLDEDIKTSDGGGYSYTYNLVYDSPGYYSATWNGFYKLEVDGNTRTYTSQFKDVFTESHSGQSIEGGWESNYVHTITSEDEAQPWNKGESATDGFYRLIVQGDDGNGNILDWDYTFIIRSEGLEFENTATSGCRFYYKDGYIEFSDASNNILRYTYTCTSYSYSFNGTVINTFN